MAAVSRTTGVNLPLIVGEGVIVGEAVVGVPVRERPRTGISVGVLEEIAVLGGFVGGLTDAMIGDIVGSRHGEVTGAVGILALVEGFLPEIVGLPGL